MLKLSPIIRHVTKAETYLLRRSLVACALTVKALRTGRLTHTAFLLDQHMGRMRRTRVVCREAVVAPELPRRGSSHRAAWSASPAKTRTGGGDRTQIRDVFPDEPCSRLQRVHADGRRKRVRRNGVVLRKNRI